MSLYTRPDTCEFVRTFNMQQDSGVTQTLTPYEIVEWISGMASSRSTTMGLG